MPVLVNQGAPFQSATPVGGVAGPVVGGQWLHGSGPAMVPQPVAPVVPSFPPATLLPHPSPAIQAPARGMTCEELCERIRQMERERGLSGPLKEMPKGQGKEE